jgi:sulfoacetaldehyde dehydrogenase
MKSVDELITTAREAQKKVDNYTQEQINGVCLAIGWEV